MRPARAITVVLSAAALAAAGACAASDPAVDAGATTTTVAPAAGGALGAELSRLQPEATGAFIGEAAQRTLQADTGSYLVSMVLDEGTPDALTLLSVQGTYDHDRGVARTVLDISGLAERAPEVLTEDPDEQAALRLVFRDPLEIVEDEDTTFLRAERLTTLLQSPTDWVTMPLDSQDSFGSIASAFEVSDLSAFLDELDAAGAVEDLGREELDGDDVWHYRVAIGDDGGGSGGGLFGAMAGEGADDGTVEVWVDDRGVIHQLTAVGAVEAVLPALGADFGGLPLAEADLGPGEVTLVIELHDLGVPATIAVPDPEATTPLDSLEG